MSVDFRIFYLNQEELTRQVCLIKYIENEISNSTLHKTKKQKRRAKTYSNFNIIISETPEKLFLVTLVMLFIINYWWKFEKKIIV